MARAATQSKKRKSKKLTLAESRALLRKLDQDNLDCREAHWWVEIGYFYDAFGDIRRLFECARCTTTKRNRLNRRGEFVGATSYKHPAGYRIGRIKRIEVREERIRRAKVYANENSMLANTDFNFNGNGKATKKKTYPVRHQQKQKASR